LLIRRQCVAWAAPVRGMFLAMEKFLDSSEIPAETAPKLARKTRPQAGDRRYGRSAVSNGAKPMLGVDGRSAWLRRRKDLISDHTADYGGDLSVAQQALLERQASELIACEQIEARMAAGEALPEDVDQHARLTGNIRRNYEMLGIERRARPVNDDLDGVLARVAQRKASANG
jgi:hypothetical protein